MSSWYLHQGFGVCHFGLPKKHGHFEWEKVMVDIRSPDDKTWDFPVFYAGTDRNDRYSTGGISSPSKRGNF